MTVTLSRRRFLQSTADRTSTRLNSSHSRAPRMQTIMPRDQNYA